MVLSARSAGRWVQLLQAMTVRELVEGMGVSVRRAAAILGVAPSAVSQYLSGKRLARVDAEVVGRVDLRAFARRTAEQLLATEGAELSSASQVLLLARAAELAQGRDGPRVLSPPAGRPRSESVRQLRATLKSLRRRVVAEQAAVADCMRLAQRARDELTRAIFRQLASDSLRHAEIVASLSTYLDRGITHTQVSGITRREVERLIDRERAAEKGTGGDLTRQLGGVMALLAASMEADERKHEELLSGLLGAGFASPEGKERGARAG